MAVKFEWISNPKKVSTLSPILVINWPAGTDLQIHLGRFPPIHPIFGVGRQPPPWPSFTRRFYLRKTIGNNSFPHWWDRPDFISCNFFLRFFFPLKSNCSLSWAVQRNVSVKGNELMEFSQVSHRWTLGWLSEVGRVKIHLQWKWFFCDIHLHNAASLAMHCDGKILKKKSIFLKKKKTII